MLESNLINHLNNSQKNYWLNRLSDGQALLNMPKSGVPVKNTTNNIKCIRFALSEKTTIEFHAFIKNDDFNIFFCLLASWKTLFYRYTSQNNIIVGSLVSNSIIKNQSDLWRNTLLLRSEIDPLNNFNALYQTIKASTLLDFQQGNYLFSALKEDIKTDFKKDPKDLFNIMISPKILSNESEKGDDNLFEDIDLSIAFEKVDNQLIFEITYNSLTYDTNLIEKLIAHYKQLLPQLLTNPHVNIGEIDFLLDEERNILLDTIKSESVDYPKEKTLVDLFNEQVIKNPTQIALVFQNIKFTYIELDELSNQFANYLLDVHRVNDNDLVAVILARSEWIVICLLGILKSGCAYVPIDPNYPQQRKDYILNDSNSKVIINETLLRDFINNKATYSIKKPEKIKPSPENLCYIIYTSGTTGNPKGVMIEHRNVVRLFFSSTPLFDFNEKDVWCMFHSFCFDFSVWEMYGALLFGGKLIIVPEMIAKDPFEFISLIDKEGVTILNQTPSAFINLMENTNNINTNLNLRNIIFGGEALFPKHLEKWYKQYPNIKFINMYGITETTVHVTYKEIDEIDINKNISNIGNSIPTLSIYILNEFKKLQPIGVIGELYISGMGLARGYLNRPELTDQKFINNPFIAGERMYSSGDLARWLPDGNIEYIGRKDDQVKIRGHRIELGEIESKLNLLPEIKRAVVLASNHLNGETQLVAYLQPKETKGDIKYIRQQLEDLLPYFMIPSIFMWVEDFPITSNGKVDKKNLPEPEYLRPHSAPLFKKPQTKLEKDIASIWSQYLKIPHIGIDDNFFDMGGSSLLAQKVITVMRERFNLDLPVTKIYQYPTIAGIAGFLNDEEKTNLLANYSKLKEHKTSNDVAIVGMSVRFPGAESIDDLWEVLKNGKETISFFTDEELDKTIPEDLKNNPLYVKARGIVPSAKAFDANFFGINPKLAETMDPQLRLFLEISWEVLEQSGHLPKQYSGSVGVYAGIGRNTYFENNLLHNKALLNQVGVLQVDTVNEKDYIASRTAYHLNLKGPAISVHSACSTSLLAIAEAVESIRSGQCDVALAGGSSLTAPIYSGHLYQEGSMLSPDGHCRPFDANGKGTVFSDGAGVILLKSLENAKKDGDYIYGVIKGIGINNDGSGKGSFTAPSAEGQANAITRALHDAQISPTSISYVETHGTATPIGDPIEMEGLQKAFGKQEQNNYCAIGSIKSNMGHLTAAAGVAGLIKTMLAFKHKQIPASLGFDKPNPSIDFSNSPFFVNNKLSDWKCLEKRRAGISSFGVGGTNVHIVVEDYESEQSVSGESRPLQIIAWSAKSDISLDGYKTALGNFTKSSINTNLADIAYSLNTTRDIFGKRSYVLATDTEDAFNQLLSVDATSIKSSDLKIAPSNLAFLFPGQGAQYLQMGKVLYEQEAVFREAVDKCSEVLTAAFNFDIRDIIYPEDNFPEAEIKLKDTQYTQPALFVIEYALSQLWISWGIRPTLLCGHSIGEFVAAHLAGIFSLEDALHLIAKRGKLVSELPRGSMLSVRANIDKIKGLIPENLSIAAINSDNLIVISGTDKDIENFTKTLDVEKIANKLLLTSHAFHSNMMDPVLDLFHAEVKQVKLNVPRLPIVSTVTGDWLTDAEATSTAYWTNHLRATVNFSGAMETVLSLEDAILLEVGPGRALTTLSMQKKGLKSMASISSLTIPNPNENAYHTVLSALGNLWLNGVEPDWNSFYIGQNRKNILLPSYVFDRKPCWVDPLPILPISDIKINNTNTVESEFTKPLPNANTNTKQMRKPVILEKIAAIIEENSGIEIEAGAFNQSFLELGLDSLVLTQMAINLKNEFNIPITFRQLNGELGSPNLLAEHVDKVLPKEIYAPQLEAISSEISRPIHSSNMQSQPLNLANSSNQNTALNLISQQIQLLGKQIELLQGNSNGVATNAFSQNQKPAATPLTNAIGHTSAEDLTEEEKKEHQKPFGASPRIEKQSTGLNKAQKEFLDNLIISYNKKTLGSKTYSQKHRSYMSDPRVVSGFKPATKELTYPIVIEKSSGNRLWDLDGNEYIDALNGFGSCLFGHQPDFIKEALHKQIESGFEVGPQHPLAGEVCKLLCEFTGHERAALCNTGSEAVLGSVRIARTVTGRSLVVCFKGSYHGINDEALVRGSKILKTFPAAAGILSNAVQNVLVLDYGTDESLNIIKERAHELAAVLVEPVQSRRPDFQPVEFLKKVRDVTIASGTVLIFDEVITGFRMHPGGAQALFDIKADIATYGKVIGGGISIGAILGYKKYMDTLDGGFWQFGDDSSPEVGVTYFAGTFVRHPLALASAKASLMHMKVTGETFQNNLNTLTKNFVDDLTEQIQLRNLPIEINYFGSLWKLKFVEEIPYAELLFVMLREKGIHIWDGFPCFMTCAYNKEDVNKLKQAFTSCLDELIEVGIFNNPGTNTVTGNLSISTASFNEKSVQSLNTPPAEGARLGLDETGNPAWFIEDKQKKGSFIKIDL
ncbi:non-ribosomal peptide synthetase/type I polyketide synthase [Paucihalobacter sp.]|uniref:non-ribosomal peptide synthetase/type I polyketide synthase n=1 Tax=Paucihalobacter sp. TaxID=2850405 RepID=UPI002FE05923